MSNIASQPDFDPRSVKQLKARLLAELPALERLVAAVRAFCTQKKTPPTTALPCTSCPKGGTPHEPCERLEAYLDSLHRGRLHGERTIGVNLDEVRGQTEAGSAGSNQTEQKADRGTFRNLKKVESFDAMELYKSCWDLLSLPQQEAVYLHYHEGKGTSEIAVLLNRKPSTISGRLERAKRIKAEHDEKMRRQEFKIRRELENEI